MSDVRTTMATSNQRRATGRNSGFVEYGIFTLPHLNLSVQRLFTGLSIPEQSVTKQRRNKTRNSHHEVQDARALCGNAEGSSGEDLEYTDGEKRSAGKSPAFLRQRNPHRRVMADG